MDSKTNRSTSGTEGANDLPSTLLLIAFAAAVFFLLMTPWILLADQNSAAARTQTPIQTS